MRQSVNDNISYFQRGVQPAAQTRHHDPLDELGPKIRWHPPGSDADGIDFDIVAAPKGAADGPGFKLNGTEDGQFPVFDLIRYPTRPQRQEGIAWVCQSVRCGPSPAMCSS